MSAEKPWVSGPKELLEHADEHLKAASPFDCRIALISVDNAVELSIKTYVSLPERARGVPGPSREEIRKSKFSFPKLMDLMEDHFSEKLIGIQLDDIEWYHRVRNTLYHEGNGVTVDPSTVDAYLQVARVLLRNLFKAEISTKTPGAPHSDLGNFVLHWASMESGARSLADNHLEKPNAMYDPLTQVIDGLVSRDILTGSFRSRFDSLANFRNQVMHGHATASEAEWSHFLSEAEDLMIEVAEAQKSSA